VKYLRRAELEAPLDPAAALKLAKHAARRALVRSATRDSDAMHDVAAEAIVVLLRRAIPLRRPSVLVAVKYVARKITTRRVSWAILEELTAELSARQHPAPDEKGEEERDLSCPLSRTFRDGSTARLDGEPCEADVEALTLEAPDGSVTRGQEALRRAHRLLLEEQRRPDAPLWAFNAQRVTTALERDAQLLSVVGLPWRVALERLAASGIVVTRDGLRSGQRAARLRCMGLTAHDAARR